MNELENLKPQAIWKHFYSLTRIPRPSKKEGEIIQFMREFGENLGLETIVDEVGNVIIRKPATSGMENKKGVILQAHLDMVPQKNSDTDHDFEKDPIEAYVDGEWVTAKGTTLGSDNGMGVAAAMAVLESKELQHGPVEALFTIDEESGMTGAENLKPGLLKGDILLNMDSEDEGELYVGCAGGVDTISTYTMKRSDAQDSSGYKLIVKGLKGGHSGLDIHLNRGNACLIINKVLKTAAERLNVSLSSIDAGSLRNAIPREAFADVAVPTENANAFEAFITEAGNREKEIYREIDPGLSISVEKIEAPDTLIDKEIQTGLFEAVENCPNGVIKWSEDMPGVVETSSNLSIIKSDQDKIEILCLTRSAVDNERDRVAYEIAEVFRKNGAEVVHEGAYPGWKPNPESDILKVMKRVYDKDFGKVPAVKVIHAGLECGILGAAYPHWDMISFGPTIRYPHSPDEKVHIGTVEKFWKFLVETLTHIPEKD